VCWIGKNGIALIRPGLGFVLGGGVRFGALTRKWVLIFERACLHNQGLMRVVFEHGFRTERRLNSYAQAGHHRTGSEFNQHFNIKEKEAVPLLRKAALLFSA